MFGGTRRKGGRRNRPQSAMATSSTPLKEIAAQSNKSGGNQPIASPKGGQQKNEKIQSAVDSWLGAQDVPEEDPATSEKRTHLKKVKSKGHKSFSEVVSFEKKPKEKKKKSGKEKKGDISDTRLFGVPIELAARRSDPEGLIPLPLRNAVKFLNTRSLEEEGLYRVPGSHAKYLEYKAAFDAGENVDFLAVEKVHQNVAMMVIKFLKDMPEPLYTDALTPRLKKVLYGVKDKVKQKRLLRRTIGMLPLVNREVLRFLVAHLRVLAEHRTEEHMNASILSWGISLGQTMGRLMEVLFEGGDELIPQTIVFGVSVEVAAQRSHKQGLIPGPVRSCIDHLLAAQASKFYVTIS
tara:strand:- start:231 stop:1280 length:1050 start_codon:yes stop_codon:yes gene_type:complete